MALPPRLPNPRLAELMTQDQPSYHPSMGLYSRSEIGQGRPDGDDYAHLRARTRKWLSSRRPEDFEDGILEVEGKIQAWPEEERFLARLVIRECQAVFESRIRKTEKMARQVFELSLTADTEKLGRLFQLWQERKAELPEAWQIHIARVWDNARVAALSEKAEEPP